MKCNLIKPCTYLQHIKPVGIAEVPAPNLGAHIPAVEGVRGELDPAAIETHVRDRW